MRLSYGLRPGFGVTGTVGVGWVGTLGEKGCVEGCCELYGCELYGCVAPPPKYFVRHALNELTELRLPVMSSTHGCSFPLLKRISSLFAAPTSSRKFGA